MAKININRQGMEQMFAQVGERLKETTDRVVRETADLPVEESAQRLQEALKQIGATMPSEQCRDAVETMRAGKVFTFRLQ